MNISWEVNTSSSKTYLSAEEFIDIWKGKYLHDPNLHDFFYQEGGIEISNPDYYISHGKAVFIVNFRNVEVDGVISLDEDREYLPINISGVIFNDQFHISSGTFLNFFIGRNPGENIFKKGLNILGGTFKNDTSFSSIGSSNDKCDIEIRGGFFETKLRIWSTNNAKLYISKGNFNDGLSLFGTFDEIFIGGGTYNSNIELESLYCKNNFQIVGGFFSKFINPEKEWNHDEFPKFTKFIECGIVRRGIIYVLENFVISNIDCKYINLGLSHKSNYSFINNLYIIDFNKSLFIQSLYNSNLCINKLHVENSTILNGHIFRFDNFNIAEIILENIIAQGNLYLNKLKGGQKFEWNYQYYNQDIKHRLCEDSIPIGININKIPHISELKILFSDLGNSIFFNCDFSNFKLTFESSKIENLYLVGTFFPKIVYNEGDNKLHQEKIAYSQLKKVFEKNDIHTSSQYLLNEIETYRNVLKSNNKNFSDRIVLFFNKITSNHGHDWTLSLLCIFIFNVISFSILLRSLDFTIDISIYGIINYFKLLSYFFTYLNPIHRSDFLSSCGFEVNKWGATTELIDSLSKLINAYLIYQFIQAFRKFGKK